ncbi:PTS galactitol transporter subunit IIC [Streptococcus didelphis]|uniref:PTS galactitol transporter subunit IIC n=1 Tax=Streptococcus didelphis TaxID=102886 RepID=UPI000371BD86|nr:PTS galactitol transporter subunit IIC [Streptococcus didelphis]WMB29311.1 PTS galactitol transporter subunit IIC [Streptococcus didelphis]
MQVFLHFVNIFFKPIIDLGSGVVMLIVMTVLAMVFGVKFTKALEGGIKLAIALTGIGAIIGILTGAFSESLQAFVKNTGISLNIIDVGWAPLATITWGSPYTLYFLLLMLIVNIVMIVMKKTDTLDVDIFDIWHLSITGLLIMWYAGRNHLPLILSLTIATIAVIFVGVLKIINSDLMKPTFDDLLGVASTSPMTSTHMNYMMNPIIMVLDKLFDKVFPGLDKYDFDAAKLNKKIGFWGSKFFIGMILGFVIGIMGDPHLSWAALKHWFELGFIAGACLELFSLIGSWFIAAVEPLSQGITNFANSKMGGRRFNIGLDWPFIAGRAEIWACANILAPIMLVEAILLSKVGNGILPLAGIIAMGVTPALLVVTRGRLIRMIIFGSLLLPLFLLSGTMIAPFTTELAKKVGAFPAGAQAGSMITHSTLEGPMEKIFGYVIGQATKGQLTAIFNLIIFVVIYLALFMWYAKQMKKRNALYQASQN